MNSTCHIDDFGPLPLLQPQLRPELRDIVRRAAAEQQAIYPVGGQTQLGYGISPTRSGSVVDVRTLNTVIDYPARDMTITVQAGIALAGLQNLLRTENQRLPIDVPNAAHATLGGVLATNISGPRRYGHGTLRDYVIGISVVNEEGHEVKAGGRVVKNVAGYDLCKLHIGALGTLGIITQVTLKLRPLPEETAVVLVGCDTNGLGTLLDIIHRSRTRPVCVDVLAGTAVAALNRQSSGLLLDAPCVLVIGFEEKRPTVAWQVEQLTGELAGSPIRGQEARIGPAAETLWQALTEFPAWPDAVLSFKANLLPSATAGFLQQAAAMPEGLLLHAHAGNGIVIGHAVGALTVERAGTMLTLLRRQAAAAQGNLVVLRCPPAWKATVPVWGEPRADLWLMRAVKEKLDPRGLFNPGRFVV